MTKAKDATARARVAQRGPKGRPAGPTPPPVRVERFFARHLRHLSGEFAGDPFQLEKWQRHEIVEPLFGTLDRRGFRVYREGLIGIARGNGKSPLAAGLALYGLYADNEPGAEVFSLAGSRPQARIVFGVARDMVLNSPFLRAASKIYKDAIEVPETGSVYRVLSADARLAHGYNPHVVVVDELHVHKKPDLYEAMQSALHKRRQPLLISITTAGFDRDSICWQLYQRGKRGDDPRFFFKWYEAPADARITDTRSWRKANPGSWLSIASLRDQRARMPEPVFRRLHLNQWTTAESTWITAALWDQCDGRPRIKPGADVYVAVDAAPKRDTTAIVIVHRDANGHHHVLKWIFESDRAMGYLDYAAVEELIREVCRTYNVRRLLFDPFTMMRSMIMLADEGLPVEEYPQNDARMVPASQTLYDLVLEHRLHHGGDADLRTQALNAAAKETPRGWRLHKMRSAGKIDAVVALAMACHVAEQDVAAEAVTPTILGPAR